MRYAHIFSLGLVIAIARVLLPRSMTGESVGCVYSKFMDGFPTREPLVMLKDFAQVRPYVWLADYLPKRTHAFALSIRLCQREFSFHVHLCCTSRTLVESTSHGISRSFKQADTGRASLRGPLSEHSFPYVELTSLPIRKASLAQE